MAISFLKKSFSTAYNGYQNKIIQPDTFEDESDDEELNLDNLISKNYFHKSNLNEHLNQPNKKNIIKHFNDKKFIKINADENLENEDIYFNIFEKLKKNNNNFVFESQRSFNCLIPSMWPKELFQNQNNLDNKSNKNNIYHNTNDIKFYFDINKFDEYGFLIEKKNKEVNNLINLSLDENDNLNNKVNSENCNKNSIEQSSLKQIKDKLKIENDLIKKWISYLEMTYNQIDEPRTKWNQIENKIKHNVTLDYLIKKGIPIHLRSNLWLRFSDAYLMKTKCKFNYAQLCNQSNHVYSLNDNQLLCVLPKNICFQKLESTGIQRLKRLLQVIKWLERNGTNLLCNNNETLNLAIIAANLLLIANEEETFWLIISILNEWKLIFNDNLTNKSNNKIKNILKEHCLEIYEKLNADEIDLNLIINYWFSSFFANNIQKPEVLFHFWDLYFYYGFIVMFQLTLGLILHEKDNLLKIINSAHLFNTLNNLPEELLNDKEILILIWEIGHAKLDHLNSEFYTNKYYYDLKIDKLKIGIPAIQLFNENTPGIQLVNNGYSLNPSININNEIKYKNVKQTTILMELHEAIVAIGKHFESNDSGFIANFDLNFECKKTKNLLFELDNYNINVKSNLNKEKTKNNLNQNLNSSSNYKKARALIDFQKNDSDELGFCKNDIIKILDERDEYCWTGELNGICGWFPAKFVEILDEKFGEYNECSNDKVTPFINDLVRGRLCSVLKCILNYGLKKSIFFQMHPWIIIENIKKNYMDSKNNKTFSKFILTKTFKLDEFSCTLNAKELFFKSVIYINETHQNEPMDVKLRSLICIGLNHRLIHKWFSIYCNENKIIIDKNYHNSNYVNTPVWKMIKLELKLLKQFSFSLNPNAELIQEIQSISPISKAGVRDMLEKHHLFSWDN